MPDDVMRRELVDDLRALRRVEGEPTESRFADRRALIEHLGRGSVTTAFKRFMALAEEVGLDVGSPAHAYFFTAGVSVGGNNLDDRLRTYSETYFVVEKTALRRSDRGAELIAHIIRDRSVVQRPEVYLWLTQDGPIVGLTASFMRMRNLAYREPRLYVNGDAHDLPDLTWSEFEPNTGLMRARHRVEVDLRESRQRHRLVNFHLWWIPRMRPTFELRASITDLRLAPSLRVDHEYRASAEIYWQIERQACDVNELAVSAYKFN